MTTGMRFDGGPVLELETAISPDDVERIRIWAAQARAEAIESAARKVEGFKGTPFLLEHIAAAIRSLPGAQSD